MAELQAHSPLGMSSASRYMKCPGSVSLSRGIEDPESDYAAEGTAAHALGEACLAHGEDAWERIGLYFLDAWFYPNASQLPEDDQRALPITKAMANAVQVYLDWVRRRFPDRNQGNTWVERPFHCADVHPLFYGRNDFAHYEEDQCRLHVADYKHGAGIVVEAEDNPQLKYYAVGLLTDLGLWQAVGSVTLWIVQPRGFHREGPIRSWSCSTADLDKWCSEELVPAMMRAQTSLETASGEHCRFCPARFRACPQLRSDADEIEEIIKMMEKKGGAPELSNEEVARFLDLNEVLKIAAKAARDVGFVRAEKGADIPGWKLAKGRANRVWREGVEEKATEKFGALAFTKPELLSPAQLEALPLGKEFVAEHAYKPEAGLQLVKANDSRPAQGPVVKSMFKPVEGKPARRKRA